MLCCPAARGKFNPCQICRLCTCKSSTWGFRDKRVCISTGGHNNTLICCLPQGFLMISVSLLHRFYRPPSSQASCSLTRQWSFSLMDNIHERNHEFYESWGKNVSWKKAVGKVDCGSNKIEQTPTVSRVCNRIEIVSLALKSCLYQNSILDL